jgi:hypothetical protein
LNQEIRQLMGGGVAEGGEANLREKRVLLASPTGASTPRESAAHHRMSPVR